MSSEFRRCSFAACFALLICTAMGCSEESERDLLASANIYAVKGDSKAAIIQLKTVLQKNPQSGEARFFLGDLLLSGGTPRQALIELEKSHELHYDDNKVLPSLAKALLTSGQAKKVTDLYGDTTLGDPLAAASLKSLVAAAYQAQGLQERSNAATDASLKLDPKNITARLLKADLAASRGSADEALRMVDAVLADAPKRRDASYLKGTILWRSKGDLDSAVKVLREALITDPLYMPAHSALISLMLQKRDLAGFKAQVEQVETALPGVPETRLYQAQLALMNKDIKGARDITQQLLRGAPNNVRVLQMAGAIEFQGGSLLLAETNLTKALQLAPDLASARRLLAETYLRSGQSAKALTVVEPLVEKYPHSAEALGLMAEAYLQSGDATKAEAYFTQAAKADPTDPKARTALALTQISKGDVDGGLAQLESLASTDKSAYADLALISARMRRNEADSALKAVDKLQVKLSDKPLPYQLKARILAGRGDSAGARVSFNDALERDPAYFPAVAGLAALDVADKKPEDARKRFESLLAKDPKNYRALLAVAELRQRGGAKPDEISKLLVDAVKLNPAEVTPHLMLIELYLSQRDSKAAHSAAQEAIASIPDDPQLLDALGRTNLAIGDTQQAISTFSKIAAAQPTSVQPLLRLADAYVETKDYSAATRTLRKALEITPNLLAAQLGLVRVALIDKRPDEALAVARAVQKQRPKESSGYVLEAQVHTAQKSFDLAINSFRAALSREQTTEVASRLYATYMSAGRTAESERFATSWEHEHPRDASFQFELGSIAMVRKDFPAAELRFRRVLAITPNNALALNNVSWLLVQQGKPGALPLAERANQLLPDQSSMMDTLATALAAENRLGEAIKVQMKAVHREPTAPMYQFNLAKLLIKSGDKSAARSELEKLSKLGSQFAQQSEVSAILKSL